MKLINRTFLMALTILFGSSIILPELSVARAGDVVNNAEYYIINDFYGKLLGTNEKGDGPALSAEGKNADADSYVFVVEQSGTNGYVYLKQKSSGKYLAATSASGDSWSVVLAEKKSEDRFLWSLQTGLKTRITCKKNTGARLGCDWNNTAYEDVYYNKGAGVMNFWSVIPVNDADVKDYANARKTNECVYYAFGTRNMTLDRAVDLHIYREANPISAGGEINIAHERGWVIFDNCTPTDVKNNYLKYIKINGQAAEHDVNCRIAMYLNGAAVIPCSKEDVALTAYTDINYAGNVLEFKNGNTKDLKTDNNSIRSFKLKRGYMATLASGKDGRGYSRVYVADHADIEVNDLPEALDMRISSIHIKRWQYTSKKGFGGSSNNAYKLRCGWNYNWDANSNSSIDVEYIPIRQHQYWPSMSNINYREGSTATLSINEPDHPEQHQGCSCNGVMSAWTATTITPDFLPAGSRIGSPAPTDQGWLKEYFGHVDDMAYRCDFAVTHGYWGPNDANGTSGWNNRINSIYNDTKRPLWITEWEYGSSWYSDQSIYNGSVTDMAKKTLEILDALETNSHLERYAYYNTDGVWKLHCWYDDGWITPLGEAYRYVKSDFAYKASEQKVPVYWTPGLSTPEINNVSLANGKYVITVNNNNDDFTNSLTIEAKSDNGSWTEVFSSTERWLLDGTTQTYEVDVDKLEGMTTFRVKLTTQAGKSAESKEFRFDVDSYKSGYATLPKVKNLMFDEGKPVDKGVLTYKKDVTTASPYSGAQAVEGWTIVENGDARAAGLYAWGSKCAFGNADYTVPAKNSDGTKDGYGLAIVSVWGASTQYIQKVILPAGTYTITIPIYNVGTGTDFEGNLTGFCTETGEKFFATAKSYPVGWTTEKIEFTLEGETTGYLSVGYTSKNEGSGKVPHLVYDYMTISDGTKVYPNDDPEDDDPEGDDPGDNPGDDPGDNPGDDPGDNPGDNPGDDPEGDDPEVSIASVNATAAKLEIYTLTGSKLNSITTSGMYIINGKKYWVK